MTWVRTDEALVLRDEDGVHEVRWDEIAGVLRELQTAGKLRADLDVELAAFLLNDYSHLQLLRLTASDEMDREGHAATVRNTTRLIFEGMRAVPA